MSKTAHDAAQISPCPVRCTFKSCRRQSLRAKVSRCQRLALAYNDDFPHRVAQRPCRQSSLAICKSIPQACGPCTTSMVLAIAVSRCLYIVFLVLVCFFVSVYVKTVSRALAVSKAICYFYPVYFGAGAVPCSPRRRQLSALASGIALPPLGDGAPWRTPLSRKPEIPVPPGRQRTLAATRPGISEGQTASGKGLKTRLQLSTTRKPEKSWKHAPLVQKPDWARSVSLTFTHEELTGS